MLLSRRNQVFGFLSLFPILFFSLNALSADNSSTDDIQGLILNWTGLERQKDVLRNDWRQEQPILEQQLYLLEQEHNELNSLLENTESIQDEVEAQRLQLLQDQTAMEQEQLSLEQSINQAIVGIERIYTQLPPPMSDAWQDDVPRLSSELLTTSERLQLVVEMLTKLDDFQQKITLNESILPLADGTPYLVNQVYLGLSHGWYISADGTQAASGSVTPQGWQWQPSNNADVISLFIAILEGRQSAELLSIPIMLAAPLSINGEVR